MSFCINDNLLSITRTLSRQALPFSFSSISIRVGTFSIAFCRSTTVTFFALALPHMKIAEQSTKRTDTDAIIFAGLTQALVQPLPLFSLMTSPLCGSTKNNKSRVRILDSSGGISLPCSKCKIGNRSGKCNWLNLNTPIRTIMDSEAKAMIGTCK